MFQNLSGDNLRVLTVSLAKGQREASRTKTISQFIHKSSIQKSRKEIVMDLLTDIMGCESRSDEIIDFCCGQYAIKAIG